MLIAKLIIINDDNYDNDNDKDKDVNNNNNNNSNNNNRISLLSCPFFISIRVAVW